MGISLHHRQNLYFHPYLAMIEVDLRFTPMWNYSQMISDNSEAFTILKRDLQFPCQLLFLTILWNQKPPKTGHTRRNSLRNHVSKLFPVFHKVCKRVEAYFRIPPMSQNMKRNTSDPIDWHPVTCGHK